jgi:hypothetical protein
MPYKNPEDRRLRIRERQNSDPAYVAAKAARNALWYEKNKADISKRVSARRQEKKAKGEVVNTEAHKAYNKQYYLDNPEKFSEYTRRRNEKLALERVEKAGRPRPEVCEICNQPGDSKVGIHWDHDHATGAFRGWLCGKCNRALGLVGENPELLRALADYLEHHKVNEAIAYLNEGLEQKA